MLRPSGASRWVPCPGSVFLEAPIPDGPDHPTTIEGTALHWACERVLMSWLPINDLAALQLQSFLGKTAPNGTVITEEMVYGGNVYLTTVWQDAHDHLEGLMAEKRLAINSPIMQVAGTADVVWHSRSGTHLSIYDLKWGFIPISSVENWQLICYALAACHEQTETIDLVIVQPRGQSAAEPVKTCRLSMAELMELGGWVANSAVLAQSADPPTHSGKWCRYCKAAGRCETLRAASMAAVDDSGRAVSVELTEDQIAYELQLMDRASESIKARLTALEALGIARIQTGKVIPGFNYSRSRGNRRWTKSAEEIVAMGHLFGVDVMEERKPLSPAQAEGKGLPVDAVKLVTERPENAPKLKRTSPNEAREIFYK